MQEEQSVLQRKEKPEKRKSCCLSFSIPVTLAELIAVLIIIGTLYSLSALSYRDPFSAAFIALNLLVCFIAVVALCSVCMWYHKGLLPLLILLYIASVALSLGFVISAISILMTSGKTQEMRWEILKATACAQPVTISCTIIVHRCYAYLKKQSSVVESIWQSKLGDLV
ncbi:hypothetical protein L596_020010 [Steinernema carpocapsae]|uniref:Uncharacterized protein n=1 Tax=Steinernema carpocapsae TaxID=34508 RepID=A0A4U5MS91_STECR|nr:hypothetical protein L596_020010 [Steinernema carpocapsae]